MAADVELFRFGRLRVALEGAGALRDLVAAEFSPARSEAATPDTGPQVTLRFEAPPPRPSAALACGPVAVHGDDLWVRLGGYDYQVRSAGGHLVITLAAAGDSAAPEWLQRALDWGYLGLTERLAKNVVYNIFDPWSQLAQLPAGQSHLHAAVVERNGSACALAGWGGVGKTSGALELVDRGWRLLADDLGIVDDGGGTWRNPKHMQVYGYNVIDRPDLARRLLAGRGMLERLTWRARLVRHGPRHVRRRRSAESLLGEGSVSAAARLETVVFLRRGGSGGVRPADADEVADRAAGVLLKELEPYTELYAAAHCAGGSPLLLSPDALVDRSRAVLSRALGSAACWWLDVPERAGPVWIADRVEDLVR